MGGGLWYSHSRCGSDSLAAWTWLDRNVNGSVGGPSSYITRRALLHRESGSPCSISRTHLDNTRNDNDDLCTWLVSLCKACPIHSLFDSQNNSGRYVEPRLSYLSWETEFKYVFDQDNLSFQAKQYFPAYLSPTLLLRTLSVHPLCSQPRGAS